LNRCIYAKLRTPNCVVRNVMVGSRQFPSQYDFYLTEKL